MGGGAPSGASGDKRNFRDEKQRCAMYAVAIGKDVGIFFTWAKAGEQVDAYPGNRYHGASTFHDARSFVLTNTNRGETWKSKFRGLCDDYEQAHRRHSTEHQFFVNSEGVDAIVVPE